MVRGKLVTYFKTTGGFCSQGKIPFLPLNFQLDLLTRQINASKGDLCLFASLLSSAEIHVFSIGMLSVPERNPRAKVSANQLCNLKNKRSGSQKGIQSNPEHLWAKQWQDLHSISIPLTLMSFASLCASTPLPLGHRQRSTVKGIYLLPLSQKQANKNYNLKTEKGRNNWLSASN